MLDFVSDPLAALAARAPDAVLGYRAGQAVTLAAFLRRVGAWQAVAADVAGGKVALYLDDSIEFGAALIGAWQAGKAVWLTADVLGASCQSLSGAVDAFLGQFPAQWQPRMAGADRDGPPLTAIDPAWVALVVHTSGSTGAPQAIPKRMDQLTSELASLEAQFGQRLDGAEILGTVSHQHIYGLLFRVLWPLAAGRALHAERLDYPEQMARALSLRRCALVASPAHLKRLPDHLDWSGARAQLCALFSSGGMLSGEAALGAGHLLDQVPLEVYGSSETGGIAWRQRQPGAIDAWHPMPGVAWRICPDDGVLEVCSAPAGGSWLRLADRAQVSGPDRFLLQGRSDRIVKIEEKRISLDAVEAALVGTGLAAEARVIVVGDGPGERQQLAAFVVPTAAASALIGDEGKAALNRQLRAALAPVVPAVALPRRWRYLAEMPHNAQGKTSFAMLLDLLDGADIQRPRYPRIDIVEQTAQRVLYELMVPSNLFYFDGHFSVAPVLPGVVQVDWAIHYARQLFELGPNFLSIHALKFQLVIGPETPISLELVHDTVKGSVNFRYFSAAGQHASGRILFAQ